MGKIVVTKKGKKYYRDNKGRKWDEKALTELFNTLKRYKNIKEALDYYT